MSNVEDWERRHALPFGCAVFLTLIAFVFAVFFLWFPISTWLFGYPEEMASLPLFAIGIFFLLGGVAFTWRLIKKNPIPYVGSGGEAPPTVEVYDFLPKDTETVEPKGTHGPGTS